MPSRCLLIAICPALRWAAHFARLPADRVKLDIPRFGSEGRPATLPPFAQEFAHSNRVRLGKALISKQDLETMTICGNAICRQSYTIPLNRALLDKVNRLYTGCLSFKLLDSRSIFYD